MESVSETLRLVGFGWRETPVIILVQYTLIPIRRPCQESKLRLFPRQIAAYAPNSRSIATLKPCPETEGYHSRDVREELSFGARHIVDRMSRTAPPASHVQKAD